MRQRIQRFGRILKLRENDRQAEQIILASERGEEADVLNRLEVLGTEKTKAMDVFRSNQEKTFSCQEIWFQRQSIDVIEKRIDKNKEDLHDVQLRISKTEERLVERHRDVRMMEGYLDRLRTDVQKTLFDAEQVELDDIAVTRYTRSAADRAKEAGA